MIKAKTRARESGRPVTSILNNVFFATILPKQTLRGPKGYVHGPCRPSKHFVFAPWAHVRMYSHVTTERKNSVLSGWADKGSD